MVQSTAFRAGLGVARARTTLRPIDMTHLAEQSLGDLGLGLEILRLFSASILAQFGRLETSTTVPELLRHLRTIKSAAAGIGAWTLRDLAGLAEHELQSGELVNPQRIDDIGVAIEDVRGCIADLVASEPE